MEVQTAQQVYDEIVAHIKKEGSGYSKWYAGITLDWQDCLLEDIKFLKIIHGILRVNVLMIWRQEMLKMHY